MRHMLAVVALLFATSAAAQSQTAETQARQELIQAERHLLESLVHYDTNALDQLWSDDFIFTAPNGRITTKRERIAGIKSSAGAVDSAIGSSTNDEIKVHLYGLTAVVTVHSTWKDKAKGEEHSQPYQATHVWVKQEGRWRLVAAHVTPVTVK